MGNSVWRNYLTKPHEFDSWVKANAILGSIVATAILGAALAGLYSGPRNGATELSSVNKTVMQAGHVR
jgi:hypothetical protein